jgi:mycothiol synthase
MSPKVELVIEPRPYQDVTDLDKMCLLLQAGCMADNGTYYNHIGALNWCLFSPVWEDDVWQHIFLWDDPADPQHLLGWALLSLNWGYLEIYVQPELRGTPQAESMHTWAECKLQSNLRPNARDRFSVMWISQGDDILNAHYRRRGFQCMPDDIVYMCRSLTGSLPAGSVPAGYSIRTSAGEADALARARAQYGVFESSIPFEIYAERYRRFMQSPVYDPELDVIAVTPDGQIGSFGIVWPDSLNKVGLFEPVGTQRDFRRRGLGKAVMVEALRRLKERGMERVVVCTSADDKPAIKLYEAMGFHIANRLRRYEKKVVL